MIKSSTLSIIGPGKVGSTLAYLAHQSQHYNIVIGSRNVTKTKARTKELGKEIVVTTPQTAASMGDVTLLTVPDDVIQTTCQQLAEAQAFKAGTIIGHCSGALSSEALLSAQTLCKAHIASLHPLQTFPSFEDAVQHLNGSDCYYEGDKDALETINQLIIKIGMRPIEIKQQAKILYHTAAVVACNYLSALMDAALEIGEAAGIKRTTLWPSLEPLVTSTLNNISNKGTQGALTGPVARGDINTIQQHKQALTRLPPVQAERLKHLYTALGAQTTNIAKRKGTLSIDTENTLQQLFSDPALFPLVNSDESIHDDNRE